MIALADQEEVATVVREIKGLLPAAATSYEDHRERSDCDLHQTSRKIRALGSLIVVPLDGLLDSDPSQS